MTLPATFTGIGYTEAGAGLPLKAFDAPVPKPGRGQVLIHGTWSSLNPLEYKLAALNFLGRTPPVVLGFDVAGSIVAVGEGVDEFAVGDDVFAMTDLDGDGVWSASASGGYVLARTFLTAMKPSALSFRDAAALPTCFLSAFAALYPHLREGDSVYVPGGGGGVGHLAVQIAARALGAGVVISSGGSAASIDLARASGAHHVFNYKTDDVAAGIAAITDGRGVDLVYDATYSDPGFVETAHMVREGGIWAVLGVGPGKTTRRIETVSPVPQILRGRNVRYVNVNLLRYFSEPSFLGSAGKDLLKLGMVRSAEWAAAGIVVPTISTSLRSTVDEISENLADMEAGRSPPGKIAVALGGD